MIDFSKLNIKDDFFTQNHPNYDNNTFHRICEIILLETSSRSARELWQLNKLNNLIKYVHDKSVFWRERLPTSHFQSIEELKNLPIQTRESVRTQVSLEGCLLNKLIKNYELQHTSGSSGIPIKFYKDRSKIFESSCRDFSRLILSNLDLTDNFTKLFSISNIPSPGFQVMSEGYEFLNGMCYTGHRRVIPYSNPNLEEFIKAIGSEKIGNLCVNPYMMDTLRQKYSIKEMKKDGMNVWMPIGGNVSQEAREECNRENMRIVCNYSSEEIGIIGYECNKYEEHYHVFGTNVIVECDYEEDMLVKNEKVGRLLITKLDSYATPFIRYDIGDVGELLHKCPCGHDGQTIRNLHGRRKNLVKKIDGTIWPFLVQIKNHKFMADYKEYRFIQTEIDTIRIQIGGISSLSEEEANKWANVVYDQLGKDNINIEIELLDEIDWGESTKKIPFKSLVI
jgi:phenylacetate-coenzyme A ligase PaaK-like adenylate-forming protein